MINKHKELIDKLLKTRVIKSQEVYKAMLAVDRSDYCSNPFVDSPCYIGFNATISAPHMHAYALSLLQDRITKRCSVLDVGCGSGYLTAAFSFMEEQVQVIGIQHIPELVQLSIKNISKKHQNLLKKGLVKVIHADARAVSLWNKEQKVFKAIHVGAACQTMPHNLVQILEIGGRMIVPIGKQNEVQKFTVVDKLTEKQIKEQVVLEVRYVPLTSKELQLSS